MKAATRFFLRLAGIGSIVFLSLFLASTSSTSSLLYAQSVTFAGAQTLLFNGQPLFGSVALDSTKNLFISDTGNHRVVELPWTETSYGPPVTLLADVFYPQQLALDGAGDVFICLVDGYHDSVLELPRTSTGWGTPTTLPFTGLLNGLWGIAVDSAGDVFIVDSVLNRILESPKTSTGYGPPVAVKKTSSNGLAMDSEGDLFIAVGSHILELPLTSSGYGPEVTLPTTGLSSFVTGLSVDRAGDLFLADSYGNRVVELPRTPTGYGPQVTIESVPYPWGVAVDNAGDLFIDLASSVIELQTQSVNFGGANVCAPGEKTPAPCFITMTLNYNVNADVTLGTPRVLTGGAPDLDFTLASDSSCTGTATEGASCTVNVTFAPQSTGTRNGTVEITDGSGAVLTTTSIFGLGASGTIERPVPHLSPAYLQFGTIAFGSAETLPVRVKNVGAGILAVAPSINTYSGRPSHSYTIVGSTCGGGVSAGNSCTLQVKFSPRSIATHADLLTLQTNGSADPSVGLHGGVAGLSVLGGVSGGSLQFGSVSRGSTEVLPLTVTNIGLPGTVTIGTAITIRATRTPIATYKVLTTAQNTCLAGIAPGESCTLPIEFAPTISGNHDDLLTLTPSAGGGSTTVWLVGSTP
jgi:hypothetical protein